jgi:hypothetical protein
MESRFTFFNHRENVDLAGTVRCKIETRRRHVRSKNARLDWDRRFLLLSYLLSGDRASRREQVAKRCGHFSGLWQGRKWSNVVLPNERDQENWRVPHGWTRYVRNRFSGKVDRQRSVRNTRSFVFRQWQRKSGILEICKKLHRCKTHKNWLDWKKLSKVLIHSLIGVLGF